MNLIETLKERIETQLPDATLVLEAPNPPRPNGAWWLSIESGGHEVSIEWKPGRGFGLTSPPEGFGSADEVYDDVDSAASRLLHLIRNNERTQPPSEVALAKLRRTRDISQEELAIALNVRQATVSKWEGRSDMHVSTLRKAIAAMGGELELRALFPEGAIRITEFGRSKSRRKEKP